VIDATVGEGLDRLIAERAAYHDVLARADVAKWRARMEEARARRLQPHYVRAFFLAAFKLLGGTIAEREAGRYEIRHVPLMSATGTGRSGSVPRCCTSTSG